MDVVIMVMSEENVIHANGICLRIEDLLEELHGNNLLHEKVSAWAHATMKKKYTSEILSLTKHGDLHYIAKKMNENKLHEFDINYITEWMSVNAPLVWELLDESMPTIEPNKDEPKDEPAGDILDQAASEQRHKYQIGIVSDLLMLMYTRRLGPLTVISRKK